MGMGREKDRFGGGPSRIKGRVSDQPYDKMYTGNGRALSTTCERRLPHSYKIVEVVLGKSRGGGMQRWSRPSRLRKWHINDRTRIGNNWIQTNGHCNGDSGGGGEIRYWLARV